MSFSPPISMHDIMATTAAMGPAWLWLVAVAVLKATMAAVKMIEQAMFLCPCIGLYLYSTRFVHVHRFSLHL